MDWQVIIALLVAGGVAGLINTLAGGGPILTLMVLTLVGIDPRVANLTSTVALLPGQLLTGRSAWRGDARGLRLTAPMVAIAVVGGAIGAGLLALTPPGRFSQIVPWLVLFATVAYVLAPQNVGADAPAGGRTTVPRAIVLPLIPLGIYGGYFGGGNSFLLLALLSWAAVTGKTANTTKNALVAAINGAAAAVFIASGTVAWAAALPLAVGNIAGSLVALRFLDRVSARVLRWFVVASGLMLAIILFARA